MDGTTVEINHFVLTQHLWEMRGQPIICHGCTTVISINNEVVTERENGNLTFWHPFCHKFKKPPAESK